MGRRTRYHDSGAPRMRRDTDTGGRRAHSRTSQRPAGPTFDSRHYTHEHISDPETGATWWTRQIHEVDRALGPTLLAALLDPRATPEDVDRAALDARSEVITWTDPFTGATVTSARGEALNRWTRYLRRRARHLAHLQAVAQRERRDAPRAPMPRAVPLEEAKRRARSEAAKRAAATRRRLQEAEARAVARQLAESHKAAKAARRAARGRVRVRS